MKMIAQKSDGTIDPNDKITRGEFALMAARILAYTQCQTKNQNTIEAEIGIKDASGNITQNNHFTSDENFSLVPITSTGSWDYAWYATDPSTGKTISGSGNTLP